MLTGRRSWHGALYVTEEVPVPEAITVNGFLMTPLGAVYVTSTLLPEVFTNGYGMRHDGRLCVAPGGTIAAYKGGYPITADGRLVVQLNVAVHPTDPYIAGIRVGPYGGIYCLDLTPPSDYGFSNGFDVGFDINTSIVPPPLNFTPADLFLEGEQGAWYDPSDFSTMFQDSVGTTPVTAVGQSVGKILDKSGRNNHATQATAASRPVLQIDGNGKYYLGFDGVDDSMATAAFAMTGTSKVDVFAGITNNQQSSFAVAYTFGANPIADNGAFGLYVYISASGDYAPAVKGTVHYYAKTAGSSIPRTDVLTAAYDVVSATPTDAVGLRLNGSVQTLTPIAGGAPNGTVFGTWPLYIGQRGDNDYRLNGRIYSLIVRGALSTAQEITDTEQWVAEKTGVTLP